MTRAFNNVRNFLLQAIQPISGDDRAFCANRRVFGHKHASYSVPILRTITLLSCLAGQRQKLGWAPFDIKLQCLLNTELLCHRQ